MAVTLLSNRSNNLVTISPMESSCTSCTIKYYEFELSDKRLVKEISQVFCEVLGIEIGRLAQRLKLEKAEQYLQLPFCPNCLLVLNEIRGLNAQLRKLTATVSKLTTSWVTKTVQKINNYANSEDGKQALDSRSDSSQLVIKFVHQHLKNRFDIPGTSRNNYTTNPSTPAGSSISEQDYDDRGSDLAEEYPLFVDLIEEKPMHYNGISNKPEKIEILDPLSGSDNAVNEDSEDAMSRACQDEPEPAIIRPIPKLLYTGNSSSEVRKFREVSMRREDRPAMNSVLDSMEDSLSNNDNDIKTEEDVLDDYNNESDDYEDEFEMPEELSLPDEENSSGMQGLSEFITSRDLRYQPPLRRRRIVNGTQESGTSGTQPIEIKVDDPSFYVRENFTMCPICFKYTLKEGSNMDHHNCEHKSSTAHFQCGYCNQISQTEKSLLTHMKSHLDSSYPGKLSISHSAHSQLLEVFAALVGPYACPYCPAVFNRKSELIRGHISTKHGIRLKPYPCSVCGSAFRSKNDLERHVRTHTGERPFSCPNCLKTFTRKHHLKTHENSCRFSRRLMSHLKVSAINVNEDSNGGW